MVQPTAETLCIRSQALSCERRAPGGPAVQIAKAFVAEVTPMRRRAKIDLVRSRRPRRRLHGRGTSPLAITATTTLSTSASRVCPAQHVGAGGEADKLPGEGLASTQQNWT